LRGPTSFRSLGIRVLSTVFFTGGDVAELSRRPSPPTRFLRSGSGCSGAVVGAWTCAMPSEPVASDLGINDEQVELLGVLVDRRRRLGERPARRISQLHLLLLIPRRPRRLRPPGRPGSCSRRSVSARRPGRRTPTRRRDDAEWACSSLGAWRARCPRDVSSRGAGSSRSGSANPRGSTPDRLRCSTR
jgi:hypothetical protein